MAETVGSSAVKSQSACADAPIIIDLGKRGKKSIKKLRSGEGKLVPVIRECVQELKSSGQISGSAQPVIFLVREKQKMRLPMGMGF